MLFLSPSIKPYACGHESCWPVTAASSLACYTTSRGLSDHNKSSHPEDSGGERPYRCGLDGCGKSWKARHFGSEVLGNCINDVVRQSINGLQYHLQMYKPIHALIAENTNYDLDQRPISNTLLCQLSLPLISMASLCLWWRPLLAKVMIRLKSNIPARIKAARIGTSNLVDSAII
jgi:hypothetical protein